MVPAVKPTSRSQRNDAYGADSGPSRGDACRRAIRPIEASKAAICNGRFAQIAVIGSVTLPYDEREVSASRELSETTVQSSLGMFDCLMGRVPKRMWTHTPFAVHPFAKIRL